jgi:hypothetical protein
VAETGKEATKVVYNKVILGRKARKCFKAKFALHWMAPRISHSHCHSHCHYHEAKESVVAGRSKRCDWWTRFGEILGSGGGCAEISMSYPTSHRR